MTDQYYEVDWIYDFHLSSHKSSAFILYIFSFCQHKTWLVKAILAICEGNVYS